ncbi:MAG: SnoaL-like domain-containing protein [Bacteroidota bacterium]
MSYLKKVQELYSMMNQGQMMEAFEKFYHNDIEMIEATGEVRKGKDYNREFEKKFMESIQETHGGGVDGITANEEDKITMVASWMDVTFKEGGRVKMEEVAVQYWEGDLIVKERFYYNPGTMGGAEQN